MQVYERKYIEMTRDMDLIREILRQVECDPNCDGRHWVTFDPSDKICSGHSVDEVTYHVRLLIGAGFIEGNIGPVNACVSQLTWQGHEFLDNIRDNDIWEKTKERIKGLPRSHFKTLYKGLNFE